MRKTTVTTLPTTTDGVEIDVYISYQDGKDDFGRAGMKPKGYTLHIQPVNREHKDGYNVTTVQGWSGLKGMIEETKRFSEKRMDQLAAEARRVTDHYRVHSEMDDAGLTPVQTLCKNGLAQVLARNNFLGIRKSEKEAVIKAWGEAETRIGKYVNLDTDTLKNLMSCPPDMLVETVRSELSGR